MPDNNLVFIKEHKRIFNIGMRDAETGSVLGEEYREPTLRKAIKRANQILDSEEVEYGLQIELLK